MVSTVDEDLGNYSQSQCEQARELFQAYRVMVHHSHVELKNMLHANMISNCLVTVEDINIVGKYLVPMLNHSKKNFNKNTKFRSKRLCHNI